MPALVTCEGNLLETQWNVGSDDLVLPAFISIVLSLVGYVPGLNPYRLTSLKVCACGVVCVCVGVCVDYALLAMPLRKGVRQQGYGLCV